MFCYEMPGIFLEMISIVIHLYLILYSPRATKLIYFCYEMPGIFLEMLSIVIHLYLILYSPSSYLLSIRVTSDSAYQPNNVYIMPPVHLSNLDFVAICYVAYPSGLRRGFEEETNKNESLLLLNAIGHIFSVKQLFMT